MNNIVIEVLNREHGKKVIEFFKSKGFNTRGYEGASTKENNRSYRYYGVINRIFDSYLLDTIKKHKVKIITLPEQPFKERVMWVSSGNENWRKRVVFMKKNGKYLAWSRCNTLEDSKNEVCTIIWDYAKEIEEDTIVELTIEDISKGKGVGIDPKLIRIKK